MLIKSLPVRSSGFWVSLGVSSWLVLSVADALRVPIQAQVVSPPAKNDPSSLALPGSGTVLAKVELYFGLSKPDGTAVSVAEWQQFVDREITPRFRDGLTMLMTYGQYQDKSGKLIKESSRVVILIYQDSPQKEQDITAIVAAYKKAFQQESVLRTTSLVKVAF